MLTSRGCPFHCTFCVESFTWGKKHRAHSPERIVAELDHILSRYNVEAIYFLDEGFLTHPSRVSELCEMMIRDGYHRRVKWAAQVRVDALNQDLLKLMKEAGCIHLECGFETASDRLLRSVKKKTSKQKNQEIVALIKENGIRCLAYIMAGLPGETAEEFQETVAFIENAPLDAVVFSKFSPHPGSLLYEELLRKGLVKEKFWKDDERCYEKMNFAAMSDEEANALYRRTVKGVIRKINARDRMKNTSFVQMIRETSFDDLASRLLNAPLSIPKFLFNWVTTKFARTSPR